MNYDDDTKEKPPEVILKEAPRTLLDKLGNAPRLYEFTYGPITGTVKHYQKQENITIDINEKSPTDISGISYFPRIKFPKDIAAQIQSLFRDDVQRARADELNKDPQRDELTRLGQQREQEREAERNAKAERLAVAEKTTQKPQETLTPEKQILKIDEKYDTLIKDAEARARDRSNEHHKEIAQSIIKELNLPKTITADEAHERLNVLLGYTKPKPEHEKAENKFNRLEQEGRRAIAQRIDSFAEHVEEKIKNDKWNEIHKLEDLRTAETKTASKRLTRERERTERAEKAREEKAPEFKTRFMNREDDKDL